VPGKNVRPLGGHPLIAYAIAAALDSGIADRVVCSTDSEEIAEIARSYGADVPFLRPAEYATASSPDVEWIAHCLDGLFERYDLFAIVRPTSPFRSPELLRRGLEQLLATPDADSIRAVELVKQHPGKMWRLEGQTMRPLLDQSGLAVPWHSSQYKTLPPVYVQNGALEIVWSRVLADGTHAGRVLAPLLTEGHEGFNIDTEDDWARAEALLERGEAFLPAVRRSDTEEARARERLRRRLALNKRRHEVTLDVSRTEQCAWDSMKVRIYFSKEPSSRDVKALERFIAAWQDVGVHGGYEGVVHDGWLEGLKVENGEHVASVILDLGSAPQLALDALLRGLRGLKISGSPIDRVLLGFSEDE
jgi:CMP-N-acetylneuraminic acid synthetase